MKQFMVSVWIWVILSGIAHCQISYTVNIGAVFTLNSVIGRAAKKAMEMAISDVNADPKVLNGTKLKLIMKDDSCSPLLGTIGAFQLLEKGVAAIIGPQSSTTAHMISQIANGIQVPQISYAATDPTLSNLQSPFFFRIIPSDSEQMTAMANLIDFYGWKEVIAIFSDDEFGRNGIAALVNELGKKRLRIAHKFPLSIQFDQLEITCLLNQSKSFGPRVYVVHINPDPRLRIFNIAYKLQMMGSDYVWLATDWLSTTLSSFSSVNQSSLHILEGVVGLRINVPDSSQKRTFVSRWTKMQKEGALSTSFNAYGFYAYDAIWAVARSIDKFIQERKNVIFSSSDNQKRHHTKAAHIQLDKLRVFTGGSYLGNILLQSNFTGVSGHIQFKSDRNIICGGYEVININKKAITRVGFWSNYSGFSVVAPETLTKEENKDQKLNNVTWPGGTAERPRGWVIATNAKPLRIGVPKRASFVEFVTEQPYSHQIQGYCIDVFKKALEFIPYEVPYVLEPYGSGQSNPSYDTLVKLVAEDVYDAVVGDITIVTNRTKIVDFSQPFEATSLVIVAPVNNAKSSAWVFFNPFTADMWCATAVSFLIIGVVVWILEHRVNDDFRGPPKRQLVTMFMFSFSTLFFRGTQEKVGSILGKMVLIVWLFLLLVIKASYTANLASILTMEQLSSPITGINSLIASNWPIGYQAGSFVYSNLINNLYVSRSRLVPLGSPEEYARALQQGPAGGGVAAIIDELPYVELFLSTHTGFGIIGQPFTKSGWGFAFQRESPLAIDMSIAILKLSENGELQRIREKWLCNVSCLEERGTASNPNRLHLISFWGLYLSCGIVSLAALLVFLLRSVRQFVRYKQRQKDLSADSSLKPSRGRCSQVFYNFLNFIDEKEETIKKMVTRCDNPQQQLS